MQVKRGLETIVASQYLRIFLALVGIIDRKAVVHRLHLHYTPERSAPCGCVLHP